MMLSPPRSSTTHPFGHDFEDVSHHGSPFYQCYLCREYKYQLEHKGLLEAECPKHRERCDYVATWMNQCMQSEYEAKVRAAIYEGYLARTYG